jgi:hypothetical protein
MPRNKLSDLNDHLFTVLERLNEEDLSPEDLKNECARAKAVSEVATNILTANKIALQAMKMARNGDLSPKDASNFIQLDAPPK